MNRTKLIIFILIAIIASLGVFIAVNPPGKVSVPTVPPPPVVHIVPVSEYNIYVIDGC